MRNSPRKTSLVAALLTLLVSALLLLVLIFGYVEYSPRILAEASSPELMQPDPEEELFIEPELRELGEENAAAADAPSPAIKGSPEHADDDAPASTVGTDLRDTKNSPDPAASKSKETPKSAVSSKKESKMTTTQEAPAANKKKKSGNNTKSADKGKAMKDADAAVDKERKKATSAVAGKFGPKNGAESGGAATTGGAGGNGIGIAGTANGRTFISCPKPDVALRHKTVVRVNIVIDAAGSVVEATATGSADASIRRKCEAAARRARWSAKKGAAPTRGSLTFTIIPK